jgi:hypothetical protein
MSSVKPSKYHIADSVAVDKVADHLFCTSAKLVSSYAGKDCEYDFNEKSLSALAKNIYSDIFIDSGSKKEGSLLPFAYCLEDKGLNEHLKVLPFKDRIFPVADMPHAMYLDFFNDVGCMQTFLSWMLAKRIYLSSTDFLNAPPYKGNLSVVNHPLDFGMFVPTGKLLGESFSDLNLHSDSVRGILYSLDYIPRDTMYYDTARKNGISTGKYLKVLSATYTDSVLNMDICFKIPIGDWTVRVASEFMADFYSPIFTEQASVSGFSFSLNGDYSGSESIDQIRDVFFLPICGYFVQLLLQIQDKKEKIFSFPAHAKTPKYWYSSPIVSSSGRLTVDSNPVVWYIPD